MGTIAAIGLDVGGTGIKAGIVCDGKVYFERTVATDTSSDEAIVKQLSTISQGLISEAASSFQLIGAGVAVPGAIHAEQGIAIKASNLPWNHTEITRPLTTMVGLPFFLENDTNAAAVGEGLFGAGKEVSDFFYMAIGTGVGGGIVSAGKLVRGHSGGAGEIGHVIVDPRGPRCRCGQVGCLEALASAPAIGRLGQRLGEEAGAGPLYELSAAGYSIDAKAVFEAAEAGDEAARHALEQVGEYLALGVITAKRMLAPEIVVLGGGVAAGGELLLAAIRRGLGVYGSSDIDMRISPLKQTGVVGAASVAMTRFEVNSLYSLQ